MATAWPDLDFASLAARTSPSLIGKAVFWLVEPRRFELLTSGLQNGLISRRNSLDLLGG